MLKPAAKRSAMTSGSSGSSNAPQSAPGVVASTPPIQPRRSRTGILLIGFACTLVIFFSLALIYYDQPSLTVQAVGLLIVVLSLVLVLSGGWREVGALLLLTVFISTASVVVVTSDMARPLALGLPLLWLLGFAGVVSLFWRSTLKIGTEEFVLIRNQVNGSLRVLTETVELPPIAGWEELVARVPRYDLSGFVTVQDVPTRSAHRIPAVKVYLRYKIAEPLKLHRSQTNRAKLYQDISKDLNFERNTALLQPRFWEEVALRAATSAARTGVRGPVWDLGDERDSRRNARNSTTTPREAFDHRDDWSKEAEPIVRSALARNGIEMVGFRVTEVEIHETSFNEKTVEHQHEAEWKAARVATMVERIYASLNSKTNEQLVETVRGALQGGEGEVPLSEEQVRRAVADGMASAQEQLSSRIFERLSREGVLRKLESRDDLSSDELKMALREAVREAQGLDEQRIKDLIMHAIDEAEERERTYGFFDRRDVPREPGR